MAYDTKGHLRMPNNAAVGTGAGSVKSCHSYFTNDTVAEIETSNYFQAALLEFQSGDQLTCSVDIDGTPAMKQYITINTGTTITLTAAAA